MKYLSTRGSAPIVDFADVLLTGLASDGGLYVPDRWPALRGDVTPAESGGYAEIAVEVMAPYVEGSLTPDELAELVERTYSPPAFPEPDVTPLVDLGGGMWLLELFHGPTLAFKDLALQLVGNLFDHELERRGERRTIVVATSGDTGSAAIEACRGRASLDIVVLHPQGRVSDIQRRQMTTVDAPNVHNVAIEGTFDDCQDLVKALFADAGLRERVGLSAMNSINWARVMAQIVYYVVAQRRLVAAGHTAGPLAFSVPTGNFGNVLAGWVARRTGLPAAQLVIGSNRNDILTRWLHSGALEITEVHPTISPAMDIQVSSNLERLLFEAYGRDAAAIAELQHVFRADGRVELDTVRMSPFGEVFSAARFEDDETRAEIARTYEATGVVVDPHTAVGIAAARACRRDPSLPMVALATAHPAKFPDAVEQAIGIRPALPDSFADLLDLPERVTVLPNDLAAVRDFVLAAS